MPARVPFLSKVEPDGARVAAYKSVQQVLTSSTVADGRFVATDLSINGTLF